MSMKFGVDLNNFCFQYTEATILDASFDMPKRL